jgi:RHS repeat-associated protein
MTDKASQLLASQRRLAPAPRTAELQVQRAARVVSLKICPNDVTVLLGSRVDLTATAEDAEGVPVGGVKLSWHAHDIESGREVHLPGSGSGEFRAELPGKYVVVALAGKHRAEAIVTVRAPTSGDIHLPGRIPARTRPPRQSGPARHRVGALTGTLTGAVARAYRAMATQLTAVRSKITDAGRGLGSQAQLGAVRPQARAQNGSEPRWDETTIPAASDPANQRGSNPFDQAIRSFTSLGIRRDRLATGRGAGSGNFQLTIPIINLAGRGLDVRLTLTYNSLMWNEVPDQFNNGLMVFAPQLDDDWPAPGWSLGFGKVWGRMLLDADGTRHLLTGGQGSPGHTTDGTFIDSTFDPWPGTGVQCKYPTGLVIDFNQFTMSGFNYPTRITDADGNYIVIAYRDLSLNQPNLPPGRRTSPSIDTITDTLGRTIQFHYEPQVEANDYSGVLTAITGPELNGQFRLLAMFNWTRMKLEPAFGSPPVWPSAPSDIRVLKAVNFPNTATGYWFGSEDSYSSYGMLATVRQQRGMSLSGAPLTEQWPIGQGRTTRQTSYNFPLQPDPAQIGAPTYTTVTDDWEGMTTLPSTTSYAVTRGISALSRQPWQRVDMTYPDGGRNVRVDEGATPLLDETYDVTDKLLRRAKMLWEPGDYSSPRPKRIEVTDEHDQTAATEFSYGPYNQVTEMREYDYDESVVLRKTRSEYLQDPNYIQRHIFNLPTVVEVYEDDDALPASRTESVYDGQPLSRTVAVVQHSQAFDPDAPPEWVPPRCKDVCWLPCEPPKECEPKCEEQCEPQGHWEPRYDPLTAYRGHLTQITRYADAAQRTGAIAENRRYDLVGNLVSITTGCCRRSDFTYGLETQYAYATKQAVGAIDPTSHVRVIINVVYDFDTGLVLSVGDAGRQTIIDYWLGTHRPRQMRHPTWAITTFDYDDSEPSMTTATSPASADEAPGPRQITWLNGLGLPKRQASQVNSLSWNVVDTRYDHRGRPIEQSQPVTRTGDPHSWSAPEWWNEVSYDALGRITSALAPDGSKARNLYNETGRPYAATILPGATMWAFDAWDRWRWSRTNALGRLVEVVEPNPEGDGSIDGFGNLATTYQYNGLGQLAAVYQGDQQRLFHYDSLGRLQRQLLPEKLPTLDTNGLYVGADGTWSDVVTYDDRSNMNTHTDARGVKAVYHYGDDPLGRIQSLTYDTGGFGDAEHPIDPTGEITFAYMTTGDPTRVHQATKAGFATETYDYDSVGRLSSTTLELLTWPAHPLVVGYTYDSLDRVTSLTHPSQYGIADAERAQLHYDNDMIGRPQQINLNRLDIASNISYNTAQLAVGSPTSVQLGPVRSGPNGTEGPRLLESYGFDPATGLPTGQQLNLQWEIAANPQLLDDLSYDFLRPGESGRCGQLTRSVDNLNQESSRVYAYDPIGRLGSVAGGDSAAPNWTQSYSYDRYGNRTKVQAAGTAVGQPIPPDGQSQVDYSSFTNRIVSDGVAYDAAGNLARAERRGVWQRYRYDATGRLSAVLDDNGATLESYGYGVAVGRLPAVLNDNGAMPESYGYGVGGQRLVTDRASGTVARTYYIWVGNQVVAEYEQRREPSPTAPRWTRSNIFLGRRLLAVFAPIPQQPGTIVTYCHPGRLGMRWITNATDGGQGVQSTLPFGTALGAESTVDINPHFTSYDRSVATGLDYAVNRFYDPEYSRFTQVDPLGQLTSSPANPQSLNLYSYVGNDPVNAVDPTGLESGEVTCYLFPDGTLVCEPLERSSDWTGGAGSTPGAAGGRPDAGSGNSGPATSLDWTRVLTPISAATGTAILAAAWRAGSGHIEVPAATNPEFLQKFTEFVAQQLAHPIGTETYPGHQLKIISSLNSAINYARQGGQAGVDVAQKAFQIAQPTFARIGIWLGSLEDFLPSPIVIINPRPPQPFPNRDPFSA